MSNLTPEQQKAIAEHGADFARKYLAIRMRPSVLWRRINNLPDPAAASYKDLEPRAAITGENMAKTDLGALNVRVAETVLGWRRIEGREAIVAGGYSPDGDPERYHYETIWVSPQGDRMACKQCGSMPDFADDPTASDMLCEKLRKAGWFYRLGWNGAEFTFTLQIGAHDYDWGFGEASADTAALAIVLACLRAVDDRIER